MLFPNAPSCRIRYDGWLIPARSSSTDAAPMIFVVFATKLCVRTSVAGSAQTDGTPTCLDTVEQRIPREQGRTVIQLPIDAQQNLIAIPAFVRKCAKVVAPC